MKIADANIILRYLLKDDKSFFVKAVKIIGDNEVYIPTEIVAEIVYVLEKVYTVPKDKIENVLSILFEAPTIMLNDKQLIIASLHYYSKYNLDFADSLLIAYNQIWKADIFTFDKKLQKILIRLV